MIRRRLARPLALAALLSAPLAAQQVFRGGTDVVLLNVTVLDKGGRLVGSLDQDRFQVFEDGALQDISNFSKDPQPIALSLVIDSSTSMEQKLPVAQEAAIGFAKRLSPRDVAQIVEFNSVQRILQPFTSNAVALESAIRRMRAGGSTSLYNAIYVALDGLRRVRATSAEEIRRQAVIVLSDGEDTSSLIAYEEVLELAKRSEVIVYAIGLRAKDGLSTGRWNEAEYVLRSLAQETGGRVYYVEDEHQLGGIYTQIADELANQYTLGYTSKNPKRDGAWRRITVRVAGHDTATARTKSGYFAPKAPR